VVQDPSRVVRNVAKRIVELRIARGMTQEKLAEVLDCSVQYTSRIEVGENLSIHTLTKIANAFGVPVIRLFEPPAASVSVPKRGRPRKSG
jgi:transcriptional regulator with XRE-family HTH domain